MQPKASSLKRIGRLRFTLGPPGHELSLAKDFPKKNGRRIWSFKGAALRACGTRGGAPCDRREPPRKVVCQCCHLDWFEWLQKVWNELHHEPEPLKSTQKTSAEALSVKALELPRAMGQEERSVDKRGPPGAVPSPRPAEPWG